MVKRIDKERRFSKYVKRGTILVGGILLIFCVIWSILWYDTKQKTEKLFQDGVEQFGFQDNPSENPEEEYYQYPYRLEYSGGETFFLAHLEMSEWFDIRYLGNYNQVLMCRVQREEDLLQVEWYGRDGGAVTVYTYDRTGKHLLKDQEAKKLLRDDEQMKEINNKAHEMCEALYVDYKWYLN